MKPPRSGHLVERAVERMGGQGFMVSPPIAAAVPEAAEVHHPVPPTATPGQSFGRQRHAVSDPVVPPVVITMAMLEGAGLAVAGARRSRISEEWRVTSGQLMRTMRSAQPRVGTAGKVIPNLLMVTSSKPNEGKSFSALNLAGSLALGGLSEVLLMDLDSKPGALTSILGLTDRKGLFDLIADPALQPEDLILQSAIPGFSFLPIGSAAGDGPGSSERTITQPVAAMVERLARKYPGRVVILDLAPCLATSDASTLAPTVSQIAMLVEAERTQREDLESALEMLSSCPNITLILNKVRLAIPNSFGDYYYYGT